MRTAPCVFCARDTHAYARLMLTFFICKAAITDPASVMALVPGLKSRLRHFRGCLHHSRIALIQCGNETTSQAFSPLPLLTRLLVAVICVLPVAQRHARRLSLRHYGCLRRNVRILRRPQRIRVRLQRFHSYVFSFPSLS